MARQNLGRPATGLPRYFMDTGWWRARRFAGLPLESIGLMSCIVGYCTEHSTDGHVPADHEDLAAALGIRASTVRKALRPLIERRIIEAVDAELLVVGWSDHNPTKAQVEAYTTERSQSGAKGNHKRHHVDRGIVNPDCEWCNSDPPPHRNSDRSSDPTAIANGSHGMGWDRKELDSQSSDTSTRAVDNPDGDQAMAIARADLERRTTEMGTPPGNVDAWLRSVADGHRRKASNDPDYLDRALVATAQPEARPSPLDGTALALRARMNTNARRAAGLACATCDDERQVLDEHNIAHPCPDCPETATG